MNENNPPKLTEEKQYNESKSLVQKKPDDLSGLHIEALIKISDPESGEVLVEGRA